MFRNYTGKRKDNKTKPGRCLKENCVAAYLRHRTAASGYQQQLSAIDLFNQSLWASQCDFSLLFRLHTMN